MARALKSDRFQAANFGGLIATEILGAFVREIVPPTD
jgi:hypothetical protein